MQAGQQLVDAAGDRAPIGKPVAREAEGDVGIADAPLEHADALIGNAVARTAREKMLGRIAFENQVLAFVGRVIAEIAEGKAVSSAALLGGKITRIDVP